MPVDTPSQPLVSVIVPIYGVEPYLEECVDSILGQSYPNLEVLLIDDGSPDRCGAICDAYAARDPRVRAIHQANAGVSAARNHGLDLATGDFILFVDSDDWIDRETIEGYMRIFSEHPDLDVVESRYFLSLDPNQLGKVGDYVPALPEFEGRTLSGVEVYRVWCLAITSFVMSGPCSKCYLRSFIGDTRFALGAYFGEDQAFQMHLYARLRTYRFWGRINYYYREGRPGATTERDPKKVIPKLADSLESMKQIILDLEAEIGSGVKRDPQYISAEEQLACVSTMMMHNLLVPPYVDNSRSLVRRMLYRIQRPYALFLQNRPYAGSYYRARERHILARSPFLFYYLYLPLYYAYLETKRKLGMMR